MATVRNVCDTWYVTCHVICN